MDTNAPSTSQQAPCDTAGTLGLAPDVAGVVADGVPWVGIWVAQIDPWDLQVDPGRAQAGRSEAATLRTLHPVSGSFLGFWKHFGVWGYVGVCVSDSLVTNLATAVGCQLPPRGVLMPLSFNARATAR